MIHARRQLRVLLRVLVVTAALAASERVARADDAPLEAPGAPTRTRTRASLASELAVSIGTTFLASPEIYAAARYVGTASPNLGTSALPALLMALALPPAVATGTLLFERKREGVSRGFWPPYLLSTGAQLVVLTAAFFAKAWVADPGSLLALSAASGVACGSAATLGAELFLP